MILTHPFLFNTIVILFIAFTAGWLVYVMTGQRAVRLKNKMDKLESENEILRIQASAMEQQLQESSSSTRFTNDTPVIPLSSTARINKAGDAGK
ncbi:MAG: hypothetical protein QM726_24660 [Chitinophagaceae bacterium]